MTDGYDAIVIGAGPAGCTVAIRLALAGWSVALLEKRRFPRRKVCGECIAATNLPLLDALGVGAAFDALAGPELRRVGLYTGAHAIVAGLPPLRGTAHRWGRALGREHLDTLLLQRAADVGAVVLQPCAVKRIEADGLQYTCHVAGPAGAMRVQGAVLIHAHGSWEPQPVSAAGARPSPPRRASDLFAFKGTYRHADIAPGLLPVLAFAGGYGGMVLGDQGHTTLAFCVRRDALQARRIDAPGATAAMAALAHLQRHCSGVARALAGAEQVGEWLATGPIRPGVREPWRADGSFAVGNAAGEAHPILGEGISMAMQSAWLLSDRLVAAGVRSQPAPAAQDRLADVGLDYARQWRRSFVPRIRFAALCAQLAMRPRTAGVLLPLLQRWPTLLTHAAYAAGKVRPAAVDIQIPARPATGVPA